MTVAEARPEAAQSAVREITYAQALNEALREEMTRDELVFVLGEDVAVWGGGGIFGVTKSLADEFGLDRVRDTPISEEGIVGIAVGAAATGMRPIVEIMYVDFTAMAMDAIVNQAAKMRYMFGGRVKVPMVLRAQEGAGRGNAAQHSQSLEAWFCHIPGLKVVTPSTPYDAKGLLKTAIRDDNPVIFFESELMYAHKGEVPDAEYLIPFGQAELKRDGTDVTLITWGKPVHTCLAAAAQLEAEGISAQVLDLRTLRPLDHDAIFNAVAKTHRAVVVQEGHLFAGVGAEISARIMESAFDLLDAPVLRVTNRDVPQPYATNLEKLVVIDSARVAAAARTVMGRS